MLKLMILPHTRAGMSAASLHAYLSEVHGPLCMAQQDVGGRFRRYIHHYAIRDARDPLLGKPLLDADAITIIGFDDLAGFRSSTSSRGYEEVVRPDEANFSDRDGSLFFMVEETVLADGPAPAAAAKLFHLRKVRADADLVRVSALWRDRVAAALAMRGGALPRYVHNVVLPVEGQMPAYEMIDEISIGAGDLSAISRLLSEAEDGLFDNMATAAMVTRPKIFIP